jgi:hypothetical protein
MVNGKKFYVLFLTTIATAVLVIPSMADTAYSFKIKVHSIRKLGSFSIHSRTLWG